MTGVQSANSPFVFVTSTQKKQSKQRMVRKTTKPIVYPIFAKASECAADSFWQNKLFDLAINTFPTHFSYYNGTLNYKKGAKSANVILPEQPEEVLAAVAGFLGDYGSIYSPTDRANYNSREIRSAPQETITWENASTKTKELLICYFLQDIQKQLKLTNSQIIQLYTVITGNMNNKSLQDSQVIMERERIVDIAGLTYSKEQGRFLIKGCPIMPLKAIPTKNKNSNADCALLKNWNAFCTLCDKRLENDRIKNQCVPRTAEEMRSMNTPLEDITSS